MNHSLEELQFEATVIGFPVETQDQVTRHQISRHSEFDPQSSSMLRLIYQDCLYHCMNLLDTCVAPNRNVFAAS